MGPSFAMRVSERFTKIEYLLKKGFVETLKFTRRYSVNQFKKLAHAVWQCKYHVIWCPKYRFRILRGEIGLSVRDIIKQLCEWRKIEILEGNVQADHIHLVLSIPPKYSISETIGFLKSLLGFVKIVGVDATSTLNALESDMNDFEDAVVAAIAESSGCESIITRNVNDFCKSPISPITPEEFLATLAEGK